MTSQFCHFTVYLAQNEQQELWRNQQVKLKISDVMYMHNVQAPTVHIMYIACILQVHVHNMHEYYLGLKD